MGGSAHGHEGDLRADRPFIVRVVMMTIVMRVRVRVRVLVAQAFVAMLMPMRLCQVQRVSGNPITPLWGNMQRR